MLRKCSLSLPVVLIFTSIVNPTLATEIARPSLPLPGHSASILKHKPRCVDDDQTIKKIEATSKNNSKTHFKYDGYRQALASDSDQELLARLIYAETKAARCPENQSEVIRLIAGVIHNRIDIRGGNHKSVIFERDQFASSLNHYGSSVYKEFLCPTDQELWALSFTEAQEKKSRLPKSAVHYYLYKHHPGWNKAPWDYPESELSQKSNSRQCIRVFDNSRWK